MGRFVRFCLSCAGEKVVGDDNRCTGVVPLELGKVDAGRISPPAPPTVTTTFKVHLNGRPRTPMKQSLSLKTVALISLFPRGRDDIADLPIDEVYRVVGRQNRQLAQNIRKSTRRARKALFS